MPYIIEVVKAGNTIEVSKYYSSRFNKKGVKRGKRKQLTTDEQREVNKRAAEKKTKETDKRELPGRGHALSIRL